MPGVVILSAVRTPYARMLGALSEVPPPTLAKLALLETIERSDIDPRAIGRVVLGNVSAHALKGNPAAAASLEAGLPGILPITIRAGCASGLLALALAAESIASGSCECAVAGGYESSSFAPHLAVGLRRGLRLGGGTLLDAARHDGPAPGSSLEGSEVAPSPRAGEAPHSEEEILAVTPPSRKGAAVVIGSDEAPAGSHPADRPPLADGAAAIVLASSSFARDRGLRPMAEVRVLSGIQAQEIAGARRIEADISADALSTLANMLPREALDRLSRSRGPLATGHACGADGATLVVSLVHALRSSGGGRGAAIASGASGEMAAIVVDV